MTDRNSDMRHILSQVALMTGGTVMESAPFTDNMISACTAAQVGTYFEEGGCWGMALALYDAFRQLGMRPELVVTPNQGHALVRLGSELFDHLGETFTKLPLTSVTVNGLFQEAKKAGFSRDEVLADKKLASEIIENAIEMPPQDDE